jgi:hypothetical protein
MLEVIKTFFGRVRGLHQDKQTVVVEGELWRCTECKMIFLSKQAWEQHKCPDQKVN